MTHLRGGLQLIDRLSCSSNQETGLRKFFRMYFVAHDIMSRTASEHWVEDEMVQNWSEQDDLEEVGFLLDGLSE